MKQKKIHVVYIITKLELGGAQKVCLNLFNGIQKQGINSHLISGNQGTLVNTVANKNNIILLDSFKRELSFFTVWHEIKTFFALIKQLRILKKKYPNLIVHTHSTKAGIIGRWAAFFAQIKTRIHTVHGYAFHAHQSLVTWLCIYIIELLTSFITSHFICVSSYDVKSGIKLFPRFKKKYSIIRAAVDRQQFYIPAQKTTVSENVFIFGTVACFKPQKNIFDLLSAFKQVHQQISNTRLEIIGDGILRESIEQWIEQNKLTNAITLHGWQNNIAPIMQQWHAFVLSSLWEGLPCAIIEARLCKLPVISYCTGGIPDVISHKKNGLLYKQKDWQSLAQGMHELATNQKLYTKLKNYTDDLQDFDNNFMVKKHIQLYEQLS